MIVTESFKHAIISEKQTIEKTPYIDPQIKPEQILKYNAYGYKAITFENQLYLFWASGFQYLYDAGSMVNGSCKEYPKGATIAFIQDTL